MSERTHGSGVPKVVVAGMTHMTPRGPEATLSALREVQHDTRAARLLLGVTLTTAVTLGFLGVVLMQLIVALAMPAQPPPRGPQCRDGIDSDCDAGQVCEGGRCEVARKVLACQRGDECGGEGGCTCEGGLTCVEGRCEGPTSPAAICTDPEVAGLLKGISEVCNGDIQECPPAKLEKFVISSANFDAVVAKFPATITLHFPNGNPRARGWPTPAARTYYEERLRHPAVVAALRSAEDVLLLGRSSEGGSVAENNTVSRERAAVVRDLILETATSQSERSALTGKIYLLLMSNEKLLDTAFFAAKYTNRLIGWSRESEATLRANIQDPDLRGQKARWTRNTMNQVVVIVPLPCKLPGVGGPSSGDAKPSETTAPAAAETKAIAGEGAPATDLPAAEGQK